MSRIKTFIRAEHMAAVRYLMEYRGPVQQVPGFAGRDVKKSSSMEALRVGQGARAGQNRVVPGHCGCLGRAHDWFVA